MRLEERPYPVRLVLKVAGLSSAAWYTASRAKLEKQRPGPKPVTSDAELRLAMEIELHEKKDQFIRSRSGRTSK